MGRSFSRPNNSNTVTGAPYYHKPSDSYFTMVERNGRFYQRRYQIGFDGKPANSFEKEIHFVLGSGNHARTYLNRTSRNTLLELPLGWYAEKNGSLAMNPGYDRTDHPGFTRAVTYGCMFCHNGIPEFKTGGEPSFPGRIPEGIDCQRCHGPGGRHVEMPQAGNIVNPARLSRDRQIEVCMQCHLETTSAPLPNSIVRFDRDPFSYRPGEPLADFILHFDHAAGSGHDDKFEIAGAAYRLRQSACFQNSEFTCMTCHDPHDIPRGEEAVAHYNGVCRQCHSSPHAESGNCITCHMPKRRTEDAVHVVITDHYIQRRKPSRDLLAPLVERRETDYRGEVVLYYPPALPDGAAKHLYLGVAQVSQKSNLDRGIEALSAAIDKYRPQRMEFYLQLADAWRDSGHMDKALPFYQEAVRRDPKSLIALQRLGFSSRSADVLKQALSVDASDAATWHQLGLVYLDQGSRSEAATAFQKAIEVDPDLSEAQNSLGGLFLEAGDLSRAEAALREAIRINPDYAQAHSNLANVLASSNRFDEARYHFEAAIRIKPDFTAARFNYGVALVKTNRVNEAISQFRKVAESQDQSLRERAVQVLQQLEPRR
jgi:tetratricopeptide (TPR) repeat protein